jgi:hypothetical protein
MMKLDEKQVYLEKLYLNACLEKEVWSKQLTEVQDNPVKDDPHLVYDLQKKYNRAMGCVEAYGNALHLLRGDIEIDQDLDATSLEDLRSKLPV